jgi:hypothetical protein
LEITRLPNTLLNLLLWFSLTSGTLHSEAVEEDFRDYDLRDGIVALRTEIGMTFYELSRKANVLSYSAFDKPPDAASIRPGTRVRVYILHMNNMIISIQIRCVIAHGGWTSHRSTHFKSLIRIKLSRLVCLVRRQTVE